MRVLGYCRRATMFTSSARPQNETVLAKALGRTHYLYTLYINRTHGRSGLLWQNRFFRARWTRRISGPRSVMWNAIPCAQACTARPGSTAGPALRCIVARRSWMICSTAQNYVNMGAVEWRNTARELNTSCCCAVISTLAIWAILPLKVLIGFGNTDWTNWSSLEYEQFIRT